MSAAEPQGYFDTNSFLGEWPSRRLNGSPPPPREALVEQRLAQMDRHGIIRAAVSLLEGVWLKDSGVANAELHTLLGEHSRPGGRLLPVYTLNPTFPTWEEHLARCIEEYGLAPGHGAVRLIPMYHGYAPESDAVAPCLERLAALGVAVVLTLQLEDARMHAPGMQVPDLAPARAVAVLTRWPQVRWIVANGVFSTVSAIGRQVPAGARVWFELARVQGPVDCIRTLHEQIGVQRLVFGTNQPLHIPQSPLMELADARLAPAEDEAVRWRNAQAAFGTAAPA